MRSSFALAAVLALSGSACIVAAPPPPDPYGDLSFDWTFDGIGSCDEAGVDEVDLVLLQGGEVVLELEREPCIGGGLTLTDIRSGVYEVNVSAFSRDNVLLYAADFTARIVGGQDNYVGVVDFDPINAPPPPERTGDLALFWSFLYPTDDNVVIDCALAGVQEVDVFVTPLGAGGAAFDSTFLCEDEGVEVSNLPSGRYALRLMAYGSYHNSDLLLYDTGDITVDILDDTVADLGDVEMPRIDENFADFDLAWQFAGATCASTGVDSVQLAMTRFGFSSPEDVFDVDCQANNVVRRTFVPGSYTVTATAVGDLDDFVASVTVDLAPDTVAQIDLVLAPQ